MPLPSGYTQVEYIETTGTQYIDTGFKPNQNTRVVIDFHATSTGKHIFGARTSYPNNAFAICWESNAGWCLQVNNNTFNGGTFDTSVRHTIDMTASTFKLDGETKATYSVGSFQTVYNLYLASCPNSEMRENMIGKIYSCQVYDNGRLIRDYVPCKNSSNEAGMYDQANGVFYRNAGSGTFGVGAVVDSGITGGGADPANFMINGYVRVNGVSKKLINGYVVVNGVLKQLLRGYVYMNGTLVSLNELKSLLPTGYTQVEYIESSNVQYIDTEYKANQNTRVVIDYNASEAVCVFGAYGQGGGTSCGVQNSNGKYYQYYAFASGLSTTEFLFNTRTVADWNKNVLIINGSTVRTATAGTFSSNYSLYLFAHNSYGTVVGQSSMKLYSCQIYNNGTLVRDFIPCIDPSGTVGLYDVVNKKMYKNAGTGTFTAGKAV